MTPSLRATLYVCLALCLQNIAPACHAQTAPANPESVLKTQLVGQRFILRNMSGATKIRGTWDGHVVALDPPPWHELATLTVRSINLKGTTLKLKATRNLLRPDEHGKVTLNSSDTLVDLTLKFQGDPAALAPTLRDALFFPDPIAAIAKVPKFFRDAIFPLPDAKPKDSKPPLCDCADPPGTCTAVKQSGEEHPRVLSQIEPKFSAEARNEKFSGNVVVGIHINDTGAIADEWLIAGPGHGLDEQAAIAVSKYKFAPATCHNKPIGTAVFVDVAFDVR